MTAWATASLVLATLMVGLVAGVFGTYAVSVMPGLAKTSDQTFVDAMRRINVEILNPWFLVGFLGAGVLTVASLALHLRVHPVGDPARSATGWLIAALVLFGVSLAVTLLVNVPLTGALGVTGRTDPSGARAAFESRWVTFNIARTVTATASFACLAWALRLSGAGA
jgi:uncharacterized membrane protein